MNRTELYAAIAGKTELDKKKVESVINAFTETIAETLKAGDSVRLVGFGSFELRCRAARRGRNPHTGEEISIPATTSVAFKAGKPLKDSVGASDDE